MLKKTVSRLTVICISLIFTSLMFTRSSEFGIRISELTL